MPTLAGSLSQRQPKPSPASTRTRHYPKLVWLLILLARYVRGSWRYRRTGSTPTDVQINLRRLFRLTNGRFNDVVARVHGLLHPPRRLPRTPGLLADSPPAVVSRIAADLRADGIHRFEHRMPPELCDRLYRFATVAPCRVYTGSTVSGELVTFDPDSAQGTWCMVDQQVLHENPDIQNLAGDLTLLAVAQAFLGCRPVFTGCTMWWSAAFLDEPDPDLAQLFHFDMDQVKFLKLFVYLTDVGQGNGPHVFVRGSHRRLPKAMLEDRRYRDEEVLDHYPAHRVLTLTGPAGTMFAENTRGLHKGTAVKTGCRLLLELQYATSGLGGATEVAIINDRFSKSFLDTINRYPRTYAGKFRHPAHDA